MKRNTDLRFELPQNKVTSPVGVLALLQGQVQTTASSVPDQNTVEMWQREAAQGSPNAQYELAKMLTSGEPVSADNRAAVKWLKKAAEKQQKSNKRTGGKRSQSRTCSLQPLDERAFYVAFHADVRRFPSGP